MSASAERNEATNLVHVSPDTPFEEILALYQHDHAIVIEELAGPEMLAALHSDLEGPLRQHPMSARGDEFFGNKTQRIGALVAKLPACRPFVMHPLILKLMQHIIGRNSQIQLNATQAMVIHPGETAQNLHRDRWLWEALKLDWYKYEYIVNCMWAVSDFTVENGATHVVPGSHELPNPTRIDDVVETGKEAVLPDGRPLQSMTTVQVEMKAGSVCLFGGSMYHSGGANQSAAPRIGMSLSYTPVTLRQEENQYLVAPPEVARELPEDLQKLLAYDLGNYALGFVDNTASPMTLLR